MGNQKRENEKKINMRSEICREGKNGEYESALARSYVGILGRGIFIGSSLPALPVLPRFVPRGIDQSHQSEDGNGARSTATSLMGSWLGLSRCEYKNKV